MFVLRWVPGGARAVINPSLRRSLDTLHRLLGDLELLVRRNHEDLDGRVSGLDLPDSVRSRLVLSHVDRDPESGQTAAGAGPDRRGILADAGGEDDPVDLSSCRWRHRCP